MVLKTSTDLLVIFAVVYLALCIVHGVEVCRERCAVHPRLRPRWWFAGACIEGFLAFWLWPLALAARMHENRRPIYLVKRRQK